MHELAPIKVKIGLKMADGKQQHAYPDFNKLPGAWKSDDD